MIVPYKEIQSVINKAKEVEDSRKEDNFMCKYCEGIYGKYINIGESPFGKKTQPDKAQITQLIDDSPGIVLYKNGLAQGYFDICYCPICGRKLN